MTLKTKLLRATTKHGNGQEMFQAEISKTKFNMKCPVSKQHVLEKHFQWQMPTGNWTVVPSHQHAKLLLVTWHMGLSTLKMLPS